MKFKNFKLKNSFLDMPYIKLMMDDGLLSTAKPSLNNSMPIPLQSIRCSATRKVPATNEAPRISRANERPKNASTTTNKTYDEFLMPLKRGIEIKEGGQSYRATLQSTAVEIKRDLKGKTIAQSARKFFLFLCR